ncbi:alanine racemase [Peribacillus alkalitolerans]|uniref:alanine racemase n=1 Tax=Peribacillus alkalitolerans TaxID=1550385 RepID=UPI0013D2DA82|nr:alanine racemase [Peribacillus alkalitolerans]
MEAYYRDTWAEINLDYIYENIRVMKDRLPKGVKMFAAVKANGYGHGDWQVAETALEAGVDYLAVAFLDEAIALRKKGIEAPILVLGAIRPNDSSVAAYWGITVTVFAATWLIEAEKCLKEDQTLTIHIKFDSGMGRLGIKERHEIARIEEFLDGNPQFGLEGIYTHFATSDELDVTYYEKQFSTFQDMLSWVKVRPEIVHASNSASSLRFDKTNFSAIRVGISMYGLTPSLEMEHLLPIPLKEAFSLKTKLVHVKKLNAGESVSYGATYTSKEDEWIGTLPIGYADGWLRKLQGMEVLIEGERVPLVGRICMDQCMVKLPKRYKIGETVTLIGQNGNQMISVNEVAHKLETINYEVVCMISSRVPRKYIRNKNVKCIHNSLL